MRTWILAPDGYWTEVTARVADRDGEPAGWPWAAVVAGIGPADVGSSMVIDRSSLTMVHSNIADRWIANRIWDVVCTRGIDYVTVLRVSPLEWESWLGALAAYADRPDVGAPHYAWAQRRARWLLWAHAEGPGTPELDGAYLAVGAAPAR